MLVRWIPTQAGTTVGTCDAAQLAPTSREYACRRNGTLSGEVPGEQQVSIQRPLTYAGSQISCPSFGGQRHLVTLYYQ